MIDNLAEYENVKALIAKYKEAIASFKKDKKQKPRVELMKKEVASLEAELREFDRRQKMDN